MTTSVGFVRIGAMRIFSNSEKRATDMNGLQRRRPTMFLVLLILSTTLFQSCSIDAKGKWYHIGDNTIGSFVERVYTSEDFPKVRGEYLPSSEELRYVGHGKAVRRIEANYFHTATAFRKESIMRQSKRNCWAACVIMLLDHEFGIKKSIPEIELMYSEVKAKDDSLTELQIYKKIINSYKNVVYRKPITQGIIFDSVLGNHPVIIGFSWPDSKDGHACLLTGLHFSFVGHAGSGLSSFLDKSHRAVAIDTVDIIDPDDGILKEIPASVLKDVIFAISYGEGVSSVGLIGIEERPDKFRKIEDILRDKIRVK